MQLGNAKKTSKEQFIIFVFMKWKERDKENMKKHTLKKNQEVKKKIQRNYFRKDACEP